MSDFECRKGHMMRARDILCPKCGEPQYSVDGLTRKMANKKARDEGDSVNDVIVKRVGETESGYSVNDYVVRNS